MLGSNPTDAEFLAHAVIVNGGLLILSKNIGREYRTAFLIGLNILALSYVVNNAKLPFVGYRIGF